jgi:hypothetical protein
MSFPLVFEALGDFSTKAQFAIVKRDVNNFNVIETVQSVDYFDCILQPIPLTKLIVRPEGERKWKWFKMWTTQNLELDSYVMDKSGKQYRIMWKGDWSQGGFGQTIGAIQEYEIVESSTVMSEAQ